MKTSFYTDKELLDLGFLSIGKNVLLSRKTSIYSAATISIGNNVRIDDFCILSGKIDLGSNIHISAYSAIYGSMGVIMEDFTGLSPRTTIYSAMDDFSGNYLIGPIHPEEATNVRGGLVHIKRYSHIGANSIIFPNIVIEEGVVVGAASVVKENLSEWGIYAGIPVKFIKERSKNLLQYILTDEG